MIALPLLLSLKIALSATLLIALLGTPYALLLARRRLSGRALWETLTLLPLILPPTVTGYYLLTLLGVNSPGGRLYHFLTGSDLVFTAGGAVAAACVVGFPLYVRTAQASLSGIDRELVEQAKLDGADPGDIFRLIQLPLARAGLLGGLSMAFARTLGDFGATLMVAGSLPGKTRTAAMALYDAVENNDARTAGILALLLSGIGLLSTLFAVRLLNHKR